MCSSVCDFLTPFGDILILILWAPESSTKVPIKLLRATQFWWAIIGLIFGDSNFTTSKYQLLLVRGQYQFPAFNPSKRPHESIANHILLEVCLLTTKIAKSGICDGVQNKVSGNIQASSCRQWEWERERKRESFQRGKEVIEFCKENPWSNNAPFTGASADRTRPTFGTAGVRPALVQQQVKKVLFLFLFLFLYPLRKTPLLVVVVDGDLQLLSSADSGLFYLTCRFWTYWWCCLFFIIPNFQSSPLPRSRSGMLIIETSKFRFYSIPLKTAKTKLAAEGIISESSLEFMLQFFL